MKIEKMEITVTRGDGKWVIRGTIEEAGGAILDISLDAVEADLASINATDEWFVGSMLATVGQKIAGMNA